MLEQKQLCEKPEGASSRAMRTKNSLFGSNQKKKTSATDKRPPLTPETRKIKVTHASFQNATKENSTPYCPNLQTAPKHIQSNAVYPNKLGHKLNFR